MFCVCHTSSTLQLYIKMRNDKDVNTKNEKRRGGGEGALSLFAFLFSLLRALSLFFLLCVEAQTLRIACLALYGYSISKCLNVVLILTVNLQ